MPGWTLINTHPGHGRTFRRPLDSVELWFLWNGLFDGGADGLQYCELRLPNGSIDAHLFSEANIVKAWLSTKRRYPLAGATVRGVNDALLQLDATTASTTGNSAGFTSEPHFFVHEHELAALRPREIIFGSVACAEEVQQHMGVIVTGPRPLSSELLTQLYIFRETDPRRADVLHLIVLVAHCVTDRTAVTTFLRCFLDTLARGGSEPCQIPLEERLAMMISSMDLMPVHLRSLSPAIQRWRRAIGMVIFQMRVGQRQGGYTLPCRLTRSTPRIAAKSGLVSAPLSHTQTITVLKNCRLHGITFGNAFLVISQVAMTRVLFRRYLRGEISEEEWTYRKRQPYLGGGPLNLRRYLDKGWFERGGGGEPMLSLGFFFYQLPFMTLGEAGKRQRALSDGAPPFSDLLTFDRFLHRIALVNKQAVEFFNHPLFFEVIHALTLAEGEHARIGALEWMEHVQAANGRDTHGNPEDEVLAATDIPVVWGFGGSTAGSLDSLFPTEFPLPPTHPLSPYSPISHPAKAGYIIPRSPSEVEITPKVVVKNSSIHIQSRPAELYLTADSLNGQINVQVFYDRNVYEDEVVKEWLNEVREAVLWYLGRSHRSRRVQHDDANNRIRISKGMQTKL